MGYTTIVFNGQTIPVLDIRTHFEAGTLKQQNGAWLVKQPIPNRAILDKVIDVNFQFRSSLDTERTTLTNSNDAAVHAYTDGVNDGDYVLQPDSLEFDESGDRVTVLEGRFSLVLYNQ